MEDKENCPYVDSIKNLAYIARVAQLLPIHGKDLVELAVIRGWKCIVRKGSFKVGDLGVYLGINAVPDFSDPNFQFLALEGFDRIKTVNLDGVVSQGLLGPLEWLSDRGVKNISRFKEGDSVAVEMGVSNFVPPEESNQYERKSRAMFPSCVPKTDALRIQHDPEGSLDAIRNRDITVTRKEDGCSCTVLYNKGVYQLCGRNFVWNDADKQGIGAHYFEMQEKYNLKTKVAALGRNIAIQGEICGPDINENRMELKSRILSIFDAFDIDKQAYLSFDELGRLCAELGLPTVPLIYRGPASALDLSVDGFLQIADKTQYCENAPGEGVVVKADAISPSQPRVNFKAISNRYLLAYDL